MDPIKRKYKYAADYGLILGGYIAFFFVLDYLFPGSVIVSMLNMLGFIGTPVVCYYLAKNYRDKGCEGSLRFIQVWSFGVWLFFFAALIMSVLYFVRYQLLQPDYIATAFNQALQLMEQMHYPQKYMDALIDYGVPTVAQLILTYLWMYIIGGAILFLIISPMVARKKVEPLFDSHYQPYQGSENTPHELEHPSENAAESATKTDDTKTNSNESDPESKA
jgi:hypothetical protein